MFLRRNEINEVLWNQFIEASPQGCIYFYTWYLDIVCPNWSAIVIGNENNWNALIPLPVSQKMGISYALQPLFAQYLGVLFRPQTGKMVTQWSNKKSWCEAIIRCLPSSLKLFNFTFSPQFDYPIPFYWKDYQITNKYTYWLSLKPSLPTLQQNFRTSVRKAILKCEKAGIRHHITSDIHHIIQFAKKQKQFLADIHYEKLPVLWEVLQEKGKGLAIEMRDTQGKLHTGGLFLKDKNRWINLFGCNANPDSKAIGAGAAMLAQAILMAKEAGMEYFDFEGSMLEGVERFYRNFGGNPIPYIQVSKNTFPPPLKWIM
ncbi:MAG: hypothetical protein R3E32_05460 [Chitinophagales bacterium]